MREHRLSRGGENHEMGATTHRCWAGSGSRLSSRTVPQKLIFTACKPELEEFCSVLSLSVNSAFTILTHPAYKKSTNPRNHYWRHFLFLTSNSLRNHQPSILQISHPLLWFTSKKLPGLTNFLHFRRYTKGKYQHQVNCYITKKANLLFLVWQIFKWDTSSFLFITKHSHSVHSLADGHCGYFWFGVIMNTGSYDLRDLLRQTCAHFSG